MVLYMGVLVNLSGETSRNKMDNIAFLAPKRGNGLGP